MEIEVIDGLFSICKVEDFSQVDLGAPFCFVGKTDDEHSLVCLRGDVPANTLERDDGWRAFRIAGVLDFSLVGVLSKISAVIAAESIGLFAISTFNTDYVLVRKGDFEQALAALGRAGYAVSPLQGE